MKEVFMGIPWIVAVDFNMPLFPFEKKGGVKGFSESMQDFSNFINTNNLMDVDLRKDYFTWMIMHVGYHNIQIKLDRVLFSLDSLTKFENSNLIAYLNTDSNHNPLLWEILDQRWLFNSPF